MHLHNFYFDNSFFLEKRRIFREGGPEKRGDIQSGGMESVDLTKDVISPEAEKFIEESENITLLAPRLLQIPGYKLDLDNPDGGGTKRVEMYVLRGKLYVDVHNNDGSIDGLILDKDGTFKLEEQKNRPAQGRESAEKMGTEGSVTNAPHTVAGALHATEKFLGKDRQWSFPSEGQAFSDRLPRLIQELPALQDIMKDEAQMGGVDKVNRFLKKNGFSIQLQDSGSPFDIYAASVLDMNVRWEDPGEVTTVRLEDSQREVPAVSMKNVRSFYEVPGHNQPIVELKTNTQGERVFMTEYDQLIPEDVTSLTSIVEGFSRNKVWQSEYKGITFPMVDFERSGDITEIIGAETNGKDGMPAIIKQAKFQHRLRMNEVGARAEAAAAIATARGIDMSQPVQIDGPFIVWFEKDGVITFSARISEGHMKAPKSLD